MHGIKKWKFWDFQAAYSTVVPWLLAGAPPSVGPFKGGRRGGEGSGRSGSGFSCCVNGGCFGVPVAPPPYPMLSVCFSPGVKCIHLPAGKRLSSTALGWEKRTGEMHHIFVVSRRSPASGRRNESDQTCRCLLFLGKKPMASSSRPQKQPDFLGKEGDPIWRRSQAGDTRSYCDEWLAPLLKPMS